MINTKIWILKEVTSERCTDDQLNTFSSLFFQISTNLEKNEGKIVFNSSEVHLTEVTSNKIHTLDHEMVFWLIQFLSSQAPLQSKRNFLGSRFLVPKMVLICHSRQLSMWCLAQLWVPFLVVIFLGRICVVFWHV